MDFVEGVKIAIGLAGLLLLGVLLLEHRRGRRLLVELIAAVDEGNEGQEAHRLRMLQVALKGLRAALDDGTGRTFVVTSPESNDNAKASGEPHLRLVREDEQGEGEGDEGAGE